MIIAVSTVKDRLDNVRRFVSRNLANGVDHLVVFTEDTGAEVEDFLDAHPHVSHVPTGRGWWGEDRPTDLNVRQRWNANLALVALSPFAWADWVVHIDGDEVVLLDRDVVAALPAEVKTFRMPPLEAVSRASSSGETTRFKRLLSDGELMLLQVLGVLDEATNKAYFHGHVRGKRGVRVRTRMRLGLHTVKNDRGRFAKGVTDPGLRMLHYDSATAEEFARKWTTLAESKSRAVYRKSRIPVVRGLRTLSKIDLPDDVRASYLRRIYESTTLEDYDTLDELGFLVEVDADAGSHQPEQAPAEDLQALAQLLAAAGDHSRAPFGLDPGSDGRDGFDVLRSLLAQTGVPAGPAADLVAVRAEEPRPRGSRLRRRGSGRQRTSTSPRS